MSKKINYKKINFKNKGFTLVETLVSISIFTVSLLAVISVLTQGIANTTYIKTKLTATYLAQEGIEYMRNMRDTYALYDSTSAQHGWDTFNTHVSPCQNNGCSFGDLTYSDPQAIKTMQLNPCASTCPNLLYDNSNGKYGSVGTTSPFIRKVVVTPVAGGNEIKVTSTVYWTQGSGSYNVVFSEDLFNWIE